MASYFVAVLKAYCTQARNQGGSRGGGTPLQNISPLMEKYVGHSLKNLDPS